ncbi:hypothetical protein JT350_gp28 [Salmonella phage SAP012]|uniref:Uncharacterized protein n=1 Tax=Salmonella phage SAP012 TaxID=2742114 RepID=A0A6J4EH23_9CAUD|nr:hypothetical protein JT350_gp28 [Salmonella phage SAP012]BCG45191.1 hypothetical protein [Salmonella phage SAP012]
MSEVDKVIASYEADGYIVTRNRIHDEESVELSHKHRRVKDVELRNFMQELFTAWQRDFRKLTGKE